MPRQPHRPAGRSEGAPIINIISRKTTPKSSPGSTGPHGKFGYTGGSGAPSSRTPAAGAPEMTGARSVDGGGRYRRTPGKGSQPRPDHFHRTTQGDGAGEIERGPASVDEKQEHIHKLTHEHMKVGHVVEFEIPHFKIKSAGKVVKFGTHGAQVVDGEGATTNVFYHEMTKVRKPKPPKKKTKTDANKAVDGGTIRTAVHALKRWFRGEKEKEKKGKGKK